jgi:hypothetical protein
MGIVNKIYNKAIVLLAAYDFESLQLTLLALDHTIAQDEIVVIILNGKKGINSEHVERISRNWAKSRENKYVVKPPCCGNDPYFAIKEILNNYDILANVNYICKIDDDIIPIKHGWLSCLEKEYNRLTNNGEQIGFLTTLINNNTWGFNELVNILGLRDEYLKLFDYNTNILGKEIEKGKIENGFCGTVWEYPYIANWIHEKTSLNLDYYSKVTNDFQIKAIDPNTHYSIGLIYFEKHLWNKIKTRNDFSSFDELLLHNYCKVNKLSKWVLMDQPTVHLFYHTQRIANDKLIESFKIEFSNYFKNMNFLKIQMNTIDNKIAILNEKISDLNIKIDSLHFYSLTYLIKKHLIKLFRFIQKIIKL